MSFTKAQLDAYIQGLYDDDGQLSSADYQKIINYILSNGEPTTDPRDLIQVRRGDAADLPHLAQGEPAFTLDSEEFYIGGLNGNVPIGGNTVIDIVKSGAKGDGITDDTQALKNAFQSGKASMIVFPEGKNYLITEGLEVPENCIVIGNGSRITAKINTNYTGYAGNNSIFNMKDDTILLNMVLDLDGTIPKEEGVQRYHINIGNFGNGVGVKNVKLKGITILNGYFGSNSILISGDSKNINIEDVIVPENDVLLGVLHSTWGGANTIDKRSPSNITLKNVFVEGLTSNITTVVTGNYVVWCSSSYNVIIKNITCLNSDTGVILQRGDHGSDGNNTLEKPLIGENFILENVSLRGIKKCGVFLYGGSDVYLSSMIKNVRVYGLNLDSSAGLRIDYSKNVTVENCYFDGLENGLLTQPGVSNLFISNSEFCNNNQNGIRIGGMVEPNKNIVIEKCNIYMNNKNQEIGTDLSAGISVNVGETIKIINNYFGVDGIETQYYSIRIENPVIGVTILNNHTQGLAANGYAYRTSDLSNYQNVKLQYMFNTAKEGITEKNGAQAINTWDGGRSIVWLADPPTTGTWKRGDIVYNDAPASTRYVGWVCVEEGTPGDWHGFGVIA